MKFQKLGEATGRRSWYTKTHENDSSDATYVMFSARGTDVS